MRGDLQVPQYIVADPASRIGGDGTCPRPVFAGP
jgi:hypothetical protein